MKHILGVDPDTKTTGLALIRQDGAEVTLLYATLAKVPASGTAVERVVPMAHAMARALDKMDIPRRSWFPKAEAIIEWQKLNPQGEKRPNNIVDLCGVAGVCASALTSAGILTPQLVVPQDWTGGVPKKVRIARAMKRLKIEGTPEGLTDFPKGQHVHAYDAAALALWALDPRQQAMKGMKKSNFCSRRR